MIYFAHRGFSSRRVQNTCESFALARERGATCYELDVHLLKDGQLAVHHDYSLFSTAGIDVKLADLTAEDLKKYPLHNPFTQSTVYVPLLQEVFPLVMPGLQLLNIEVKNDANIYPGIEKVLMSLLEKYPQIALKTLFSSFDQSTLRRLRALNKNARIGLLTRNFDISEALALGVESIHINQTRLTEDIVQTCHENGLKIFVYTVNTAKEKERVDKMGADGIFSDGW